jgi:hypothetical protein
VKQKLMRPPVGNERQAVPMHLICSTDYFGAVFAVVRGRFAIALAFLAFFLLAGGHWAILQTGAWMGMIVAYSKDADVSTAISKTFDGKHPCAVCCAVQDGRKQEEKKAPVLQLELKKDFLIRSFLFEVVRDFTWREYGQYYRDLVSITLEPLIPPPRIG